MVGLLSLQRQPPASVERIGLAAPMSQRLLLQPTSTLTGFGVGVFDDVERFLPFTATEAELTEGVRRLGLAWNNDAAEAA